MKVNRKNVLLNALARSDARIRRAEAGEVPLNRSSGYEKVQRRREKKEKKMSWSTKGGYLAPIIIPSTPGGELAKQLREICEKERDVRFKIVEKGGMTLGNLFQRSNPTASEECGKPDCYMDNQPGGGTLCHKSNVLYEWICRICDTKFIYTGETSRNFYTRAKEHLDKTKTEANSFIAHHQLLYHRSNDIPDFKVKVLKSFKDPLSRQVYEGVYIRRQEGVTLNTKQDYYQASTYRMNREISHG